MGTGIQAWRGGAKPVERALRGVGLLSLAVGLVLGAKDWWWTHGRVHVLGTVVENQAAFQSGGGIAYAPRFRFRTSTGEQVQRLSPRASEEPEFAAGATVPVLYPPGRPEGAEIATFWTVYATAIVVGVAGIILFDLGFALRWFSRQEVDPAAALASEKRRRGWRRMAGG